MGRAAVPSPNPPKNSKDVKLSDKETLAIVEDMRQKRVESVKNFFTGMAKAVTTDLPGFLMDFTDRLVGDTASFGEKDRSAQLFEKMTGIKTKSGSGGVDELLGSMIDPVSAIGAAKAVIVPAIKLGKDVEQAKTLAKAGMSPATIFDQTGVYKDAGKYKAVLSDVNATANSDILTDKFISLSKVLDHPDLYALYPELKFLSVTSTDPGSGSAVLGELYRGVRGIGIDPLLPTQDFKSILLHEVQHEIQNIEKFRKGGSPENFRILDPTLTDDKAYRLYRSLPGEQEASFVERSSQLTQAQVETALKRLLQAGGTPADPQYLAADLERFTNP